MQSFAVSFICISGDFATFLAIDSRFSGLWVSQDENFVDSGSRELGRFRGGREKGEIFAS